MGRAKARDGAPEETEDQLAARRAARGGGNGDDGGSSGGSVAQRAAAGEGDEPEPELFPLGSLEGDPRVTLRTLMKTGLPVEVTASLLSAEVPVLEGLFDPNESGRVIVTYEVAHYVPVPVRKDVGGERKIVGWKLRQVLRPTHVQSAEAAAAQAAAS